MPARRARHMPLAAYARYLMPRSMLPRQMRAVIDKSDAAADTARICRAALSMT